MIIEWIYDGQIRDQHEEFFVSSDTSVVNDRLWHDKYKLRPGQIPSFINEEQANKVRLFSFLFFFFLFAKNLNEWLEIYVFVCIGGGQLGFSNWQVD